MRKLRGLNKNLIPILILGFFWVKTGFTAQNISKQEAYNVGMESYLYLYPLVLMDVTRKVLTNYNSGQRPGMGPANQFNHMRAFPPAGFREVVKPNFDTLYSSAWLDLTNGPMVVSAPDTNGRYYLLPMLDMWTDVFEVPGKRTTGTKAGKFVVVPPDWKGSVPGNMKRLNSPTAYVWIIGRTQTNGPEDYQNVHKIQNGFTVTPYGGSGKAKAHKIDPTVDMKTDPLNQVRRMTADKFFSYGAELMKLHQPHKSDGAQIEKMKRIGLEIGKSYNLSKMDPVIRNALQPIPKAAEELMRKELPKFARIANNWSMNTDTMGVYGNNYLKRATIALIGLGANRPEDAVYPQAVGDGQGKPLRGGVNYVLHFEKNGVPPVNAFWSLTLYDKDGFHINNPINRFAIGDRDKLVYEKDGSLNLYIQNKDPGGEKSANWLPAPPKGEFDLTMRLYSPKPEVLKGRWNPPPIKPVP